MPYLHWESSRNQSIMAHLVDAESEKNKRMRQHAEQSAKSRRQDRRIPLRYPDLTKPDGGARFGNIIKTEYELPAKEPDLARSRIKNPLARYLLDAARLFERMAIYEDKVSLRDTLFQRPPLHPRRTLDQMYDRGSRAWTAKERDQVLYRATAPRPHYHESWVEGQREMQYSQDLADCTICLEEIRKVPKLLMVDQLWLWILDDSTLITAFPTQYGFRKNEPSDVHKSIRTRVGSARPGQIDCVFSLGLIVIDECANKVFDRIGAAGASSEQQPILEVYAEAISHVVC